MRNFKFTENKIKKLKYNNKSVCLYFDTDVSNLGVRVYPSGAKSFVLRYYDDGAKE